MTIKSCWFSFSPNLWLFSSLVYYILSLCFTTWYCKQMSVFISITVCFTAGNAFSWIEMKGEMLLEKQCQALRFSSSEWCFYNYFMAPKDYPFLIERKSENFNTVSWFSSPVLASPFLLQERESMLGKNPNKTIFP